MSKAQSMKSAMGKVQQLFGPPQLLEGENPIAYDELLNRVAAAVQPRRHHLCNFHRRCSGVGMGGFALAPLQDNFDTNAWTQRIDRVFEQASPL